MSILEKIKDDLQTAMHNEVVLRKAGITSGVLFDEAQDHKSVARAIISMFPEIGVKPDKATDEDTIKLLKKYISMEKTRQLYIDKHLTEKDVAGMNTTQLNTLVMTMFHKLGNSLTSPKIKIAKSFLPATVSEEELVEWIKNNIDFSKLRNKLSAMGPILKAFPGFEGNEVRKILDKHF